MLFRSVNACVRGSHNRLFKGIHERVRAAEQFELWHTNKPSVAFSRASCVTRAETRNVLPNVVSRIDETNTHTTYIS